MRNWRLLMVTVTCDMARSAARMNTSTIAYLDHGTDSLDRGVETPGDLVIGGFQRTRAGRDRVEIGGEPGTVGAQCMQLIGQPLLGLLGLAPPLRRRLQPVKRQHQTLGCSFNCDSI